MADEFDIVIVGQAGRLEHEAALFAASQREYDPGFKGRLIVAEPQPGPLWPGDPRMQNEEVRALLARLEAQIVPFANTAFGARYPHGNKIEALCALPEGRPFVFFDTDTLITGPVSALAGQMGRPTASMNRTGTWPKVPLYGPGLAEIWGALYTRFGLDLESTLDTAHAPDDWRRYLYFNAGWFLGPCPQAFGTRFRAMAAEILADPPPELAAQSLDPWLDQVALPLVVHALGGGRPGPELAALDGAASHHWRLMPLLYATAPDRVIDALEAVATPNRIKRVLKRHRPFHQMIYRGRGRELRALIDRTALPPREQILRHRIRKLGYWVR